MPPLNVETLFVKLLNNNYNKQSLLFIPINKSFKTSTISLGKANELAINIILDCLPHSCSTSSQLLHTAAVEEK